MNETIKLSIVAREEPVKASLELEVPKQLDLPTASGLVDEIKDFIKVFEKRSPIALELINEDDEHNKVSSEIKRKNKKWTKENMTKFLAYYSNHTIDQVSTHYGLTKNTVYGMAYLFKNKLGVPKYIKNNTQNKKKVKKNGLYKSTTLAEKKQYVKFYKNNDIKVVCKKYNLTKQQAKNKYKNCKSVINASR